MIKVEFIKPSTGQETVVRLTLIDDAGGSHGTISIIEPKSEWRFDLEIKPQ